MLKSYGKISLMGAIRKATAKKEGYIPIFLRVNLSNQDLNEEES